MPTMLLQLLIPALSFILQGAGARAVDTKISDLPSSSISSSIASDSANVTLPSPVCTDIDNCRTLNNILQSCAVTILACVWFAVHRNIPAPESERPSNPTFLDRVTGFLCRVLDQREPAIVIIVALIAPEWILAWALRQASTARELAKKLEKARLVAKGAWTNERDPSFLPSMPEASSSSSATRECDKRPLKRTVAARSKQFHTMRTAGQAQPDLLTSAKLTGKFHQRWEMSHAFFVIMGGFHFYNEDGPTHPLSPAHVLQLVERGHLVPPTAAEISSQSKGDGLSKTIAIVQTLWFVTQFIARLLEGIPVTNLEVMTIAYTVMTLAMYTAWWEKPLNVSCAIRIPEEEVEQVAVLPYRSVGERIASYVMGWQDIHTYLPKRTRVPIFWAGGGHYAWVKADLIALLVAMAFGGVHCIAWSYAFNSHLEQQLWRWSAVAITAIPLEIASIFYMISQIRDEDIWDAVTITSALYAPIAAIYIVTRIVLIVISFTSLTRLPFGAYQTVQWTAFIPHI